VKPPHHHATRRGLTPLLLSLYTSASTLPPAFLRWMALLRCRGAPTLPMFLDGGGGALRRTAARTAFIAQRAFRDIAAYMPHDYIARRTFPNW